MSAKLPCSSWIKLATLLLSSLPCFVASGAITIARDQMATLQQWLPNVEGNLELLFEYQPGEADSEGVGAADLSKAIDRAGPTLVVLSARRPFESRARLIGGYNPNRWRNWLGRYEESPGLFIFDLESGQRWERLTPRDGYRRSEARPSGLRFGRSDLVLYPDLSSGYARNSDFAAPGDSSVVLGDSGPFMVESVQVFRVPNETVEETGLAEILPFFRRRPDSGSPRPPPEQLRPAHPVPDGPGSFIAWLPLAVLLLAGRRFGARCGRG